MAGDLLIRLAERCDHDVDAYADHVIRHAAESGREGSVHFAISRTPERDVVRESTLQRWERGLDEPHWGRCFFLVRPDDKQVVGHVELRGGRLGGELHRATLGMGIERAYTRQGHGKRLMETAIAWAKRTGRLAWIDLGVFEHNEPARALYKRMGFIEEGTRRDAFRIDAGLCVTDISMSLWIG